MSEVTLHPTWKQAVENALEKIRLDPEAFFSDALLAEWLCCNATDDEFRFGILSWKDAMLRWHNVFLVRVREEGYKVASNGERVTIGGPAYWSRMRSALIRGITVLEGTDASALSDSERQLMERQLLRYGMTLMVASPVVAKKLSIEASRLERPASTMEFLLEDKT